MLKVHPINEDFRVEADWRVEGFSDALEAEIQSVWRIEKEKRGKALFDGQLLSLVQFDGPILKARVAPYRAFLAQLRKPDLYDTLKIRPLAVSGLVHCDGWVAMGKRSQNLTQNPGQWELIPSGGLTPSTTQGVGPKVDVYRQLFEELEEELGVLRSLVKSVRPFLVVEDMKSHVVDIGVEVLLSDRGDTAIRTDEYSEVVWCAVKDLNDFHLTQEGRSTVPVSLELLKACLKKLRRVAP